MASPYSVGAVGKASTASRVCAGRVNGALDLDAPDATTLFDPELVGGFDPPAGARFDVITSSRPIPNGFDAFAGGTTPVGLPLLATRPDALTVAVAIGAGPCRGRRSS